MVEPSEDDYCVRCRKRPVEIIDGWKSVQCGPCNVREAERNREWQEWLYYHTDAEQERQTLYAAIEDARACSRELGAEVDRLRAELAGLAAKNFQHQAENGGLRAENVRLSAENAALRGMVDDAERVRAILTSAAP